MKPVLQVVLKINLIGDQSRIQIPQTGDDAYQSVNQPATRETGPNPNPVRSINGDAPVTTEQVDHGTDTIDRW